MTARRTCPACSRRYAGLVEHDCPVCSGVGVMALGAAALHRHPAAAVSRSVELYLEGAARKAATALPYADRRGALELAVDELRTAGVLAGPAEHGTGQPAHAPAPRDAQARTVVELDAHALTGTLGVPVSTAVLAALAAPTIPLDEARTPRSVEAHASAGGSRAALALAADPIDPLGPDLATLELERRTAEHAGRVLALATDDLAARRRRRAGRQLEQAR